MLRGVDTLGGGHHDWLKARHHFAFDSQGNPAHARLGNLVVWNDDEICPAQRLCEARASYPRAEESW
jgi:hypothetical protein